MEQMWQALFSRAKHAHHYTSMMPIDLERLMFLKVIQHFWIRDSVAIFSYHRNGCSSGLQLLSNGLSGGTD